jgi:trehalose/maltose transport system permease protein
VSRLEGRRVRTAWLFLTPMLCVLAGVALWPLLRTAWYSLTDANLLRLDQATFIGFRNYLAPPAAGSHRWGGVLADPYWWRAVGNTLRFAVVSVALETAFGFVVALVLNANFRGRGLVRAAVLVPWAIPTIVSAKMWSWILHDQFGLLNDVLLRLGVIAERVAWTADDRLVMLSVIGVDVWKTTPFMALLILAALQMLPAELYEAARLDGVHPVRVFLRVTLPLVRPAVMVAVVFRFLDALRIFDLIYVLTSNSKQTMTMSVYARQQLVDYLATGYGSAAAMLLFLVVAAATVVTVTVGRVRLQEEAR